MAANSSNMSTIPSCSNPDGLSRDSITPFLWIPSATGIKEVENSSYVTTAFLIIFWIIGVPSNILIIVAILKKRLYKKKPTFIILLNLSIADLLMCLIVMSLNIIIGLAGEFIFGNSDYERCRACSIGGLFFTFQLVPYHLIGILSIDRLLFIRFPLKYRELITTRVTIVTVTVAWAIGLLITLLSLVGVGDFVFLQPLAFCSFSPDIGKPANLAIVIISAIELIAPLLLLLVTNIWILVIIRKHFSELSKLSMASKQLIKRNRDVSKRAQVRLVQVYGSIFIANLITLAPTLALVITIFSLPPSQQPLVPPGFIAFTYITFVSQAVCHPIIEALLIPDIRRMVTQYCFKPDKKKIDSRSSTSKSSQKLEVDDVHLKSGGLCAGINCFTLCNEALVKDEDPSVIVEQTSTSIDY